MEATEKASWKSLSETWQTMEATEKARWNPANKWKLLKSLSETWQTMEATEEPI
jgi:hypothetical protein